MDQVIDNKEQAINNRNDKKSLDDPGEVQFKFGLTQFSFDLGVLFQGKLFDPLYAGEFLCHTVDSIALSEYSCNDL